ncbi:uncharacterized protein LOC116578342 [Mustela erminea]|uniref:uncharacterized protein LOC116578342 n=1 Tax=Mustela erminea TaxID=36723 RepID=UPI001386D3F4|nr:uncharacterized protein LOC116578342 [Mustela erminea]
MPPYLGLPLIFLLSVFLPLCMPSKSAIFCSPPRASVCSPVRPACSAAAGRPPAPSSARLLFLRLHLHLGSTEVASLPQSCQPLPCPDISGPSCRTARLAFPYCWPSLEAGLLLLCLISGLCDAQATSPATLGLHLHLPFFSRRLGASLHPVPLPASPLPLSLRQPPLRAYWTSCQTRVSEDLSLPTSPPFAALLSPPLPVLPDASFSVPLSLGLPVLVPSFRFYSRAPVFLADRLLVACSCCRDLGRTCPSQGLLLCVGNCLQRTKRHQSPHGPAMHQLRQDVGAPEDLKSTMSIRQVWLLREPTGPARVHAECGPALPPWHVCVHVACTAFTGL